MEAALLVSAGVIVNGMHGYLLWSQRQTRKWSVSLHAIKDKTSITLYIAGHAIGGLAFLLFANSFFLNRYDRPVIFTIVVLTYIFEVLQAIMPFKGRWEIPHTVAAVAMWLSFLISGIASILTIPQAAWSRFVAAALYVPIIAMLIRAAFNLSRLYYYQMWMVILFFFSMLAILAGSV